MSSRLLRLWTLEGRMSRVQYARVGFSAFAIKFVIDWCVAHFVFHHSWNLLDYLVPVSAGITYSGVLRNEIGFMLTMVAVALPFIWLGIACSTQRLRDAGFPLFLVFLFLLPALNIIFVAVLCFAVSREARFSEVLKDAAAGNRLPSTRLRAQDAARAVMISGGIGLLLTLLSFKEFETYGLGLFVALPFCIGFVSVLIYTRTGPVTFGQSAKLSMLAACVSGLALLTIGSEGVMCLMMASPIAFFLAFGGGSTAYALRRIGQSRRSATAMFSAILVAVPSLMGTEAALHRTPPIFAVKSSLVVNAPPEAVWQQVIAFTEIPEPREWIFRAGIAYPIRAEMIGRGSGAERHCIFSTGAFVEPIQVWDEPRLLKFSVASNPPPMREISFYRNIDPPHLHGFLESVGGQFRLTELPDGRTNLEGTTWYRHSMWPAFYWKLWSDEIIHKIHLRVLTRIKSEVERGNL